MAPITRHQKRNKREKGSSPVTMEVDPETNIRANLFNQVFGNELLVDHISEYLKPEDLKALSLGNRLLHDKVRKETKLLNVLSLKISKASFEVKALTTREGWKRCDIDLANLPKRSLAAIKRIIPTMETVEIYEGVGRRVSVKEKRIRFNRFFREVIPIAQNLRSLTLECSVFEKLDGIVLLDEAVKDRLQMLDELRIVSSRKDHFTLINGDITLETEAGFPQNILKLTGYVKNLKSFEIGNIHTYRGNGQDHLMFVPILIEVNRTTLQSLKLFIYGEGFAGGSPCQIKKIKDFQFPNMKSLHITAHKNSADDIKSFIENLPLLEEMVVTFKSGFPRSVLSAISSRGSNLKRLYLKASCFSGSSTPVDWSFMLAWKNLKEFKIFQPRVHIREDETQGTCAEIMNSLPNQLREITLRGLETGWPDLTESTISCLQRFSNLTKLSFMRCEQAIDDRILQFVCSKFGGLQVLQVSHSHSLTDAGLTGKTIIGEEEQDSGISLKNLKGLRHLTLRDCLRITEDGILASVEFVDLEILDLSRGSLSPMSKATLRKLARQNPSLHTLHTIELNNRLGTGMDSVELGNELKQINNRLKNVHYIDEDWNVQDSDSEAEQDYSDYEDGFSDSSNDFFGYGDSDDFDDFDDFGGHILHFIF